MRFGFAAIPDAPAYRLCNARAPLTLLAAGGLAADTEGLSRIDLTIEDGRIASTFRPGPSRSTGDLPQVDLDGGLILPRFVDIHTHLDKGHIWPRRPNPDGTFPGALGAVRADREANWSAEDVAGPDGIFLRCAFAHGTGAIRTHLDVLGPQGRSPGRFSPRCARPGPTDRPAGGLAVSGGPRASTTRPAFGEIVRLTAEHGGILGGVTFTGRGARRAHQWKRSRGSCALPGTTTWTSTCMSTRAARPMRARSGS
jgi:cytosine deaminase